MRCCMVTRKASGLSPREGAIAMGQPRQSSRHPSRVTQYMASRPPHPSLRTCQPPAARIGAPRHDVNRPCRPARADIWSWRPVPLRRMRMHTRGKRQPSASGLGKLLLQPRSLHGAMQCTSEQRGTVWQVWKGEHPPFFVAFFVRRRAYASAVRRRGIMHNSMGLSIAVHRGVCLNPLPRPARLRAVLPSRGAAPVPRV